MQNLLEIFVSICSMIVLYNFIMVDQITVNINKIIAITIIFYMFLHIIYHIQLKLYFWKVLLTNYNMVLYHNISSVEEIEDIIHHDTLNDSISSFYDTDTDNDNSDS
jgi:hypothetical protein